MARHIIVVDRAGDFPTAETDHDVVTAREFIRQPVGGLPSTTRIINLCGNYEYLGIGYYCSLLAEAKGLRVIPSAEVMLDLHWKRLHRDALPGLNAALLKVVAHNGIERADRILTILFGRGDEPKLEDLARRTFDTFRCPGLQVEIKAEPAWHIHSIRPVSIGKLDGDSRERLKEALEQFTRRRWTAPRTKRPAKYALAILHDPAEALPPSDPKALRKFASVGEDLDIAVELITRRDFGRLMEFDALLIRETTNLDDHTYRFAKKAWDEGIPVIDDPTSILRCSNKVYLAEAFRQGGVPCPKTVVCDTRGAERIEQELAYPIVLKIPDGSFSRGVFKVEDPAALAATIQRIERESDLVLAQEFVYTAFDWRIGILNHQILFACQYMMSPRHWQIIKHEDGGGYREGDWKTWPVGEVPGAVREAALKAARMIGDGLYGVDLKETAAGVLVIEVNDNPNIWAGVEDQVAGDELYRRILTELLARVDA